MNRKYLYLIAAFLLVSISVVISCKKKSNSSMDVSHLNDLYAGIKPTPQNFTVTAGTDQTIFGKDSTVLIFYPNSFKDKNGNIITSGTIKLQVTEMYNAADRITNRTSSTASDQLLQSGGQVSIAASKDGQVVFANKYGIAFKQKNSTSGRMALFYGQTGDNTATTWNMTDTTKKETIGTFIKKSDSTNNVDSGVLDSTKRIYTYWPNLFYLFDSCTNFDWINCDHFYGDSTLRAAITVTFPDNTFTSNNTQLYVIFPAINSSVHFGGSYNSDNTVLSGKQLMPASNKISVVIIADKNGTYYYYQQKDITPAAAINITATMAVDTRADIVARLSGL
jgi:hypothetical protein